ncbi:MAG TPA: hypothetical protein DIC34_05525 [Treponema sp.]|nr:hypothetical protein [Treponema sp.]
MYVASGPDARRHIWNSGQNRKQESFEAFFTWFGDERTKRICLCVMNMWKPYLAAFKKCCPTAAVVFDKFHIAAKMSDAMDAVYRDEYARLNGKQRKFIKGQGFNLLANRRSLSRTGWEELAQTTKAIRRHFTAYLLKEDFDRLWFTKHRNERSSSGHPGKKACNGNGSNHSRMWSGWRRATGKA